MSELLTVEQVATMLAVSPALVYKLVAAKELPHVQIGRLIRIRRDDVAAYLNRQTQGAPLAGPTPIPAPPERAQHTRRKRSPTPRQSRT